MIDFLGAMICKLRGHKWAKAKDVDGKRVKQCSRCGLEREVRQRKPKVQT